ncbi:MAG: hypothetical protein IT463_10895 [Planctomycetes bacterium]|nr:hypothetical protein [Planctomycetota bacterium]
MAEGGNNLAGGRRAARLPARGMTLVELTVVILLLALIVVGTITVGYFAMRDKEELKSQARTLAGFLEQVRSQSAVTGRPYAVEYNLKEQIYFAWVPRKAEEGEVTEDADDDGRVASAYHEMPSHYKADRSKVFGVWIDRVAFADGSSEQDGSVRVEFAPRGGGHWHYVYLTNEDNEFYTIEVNPFTGAAEIYPGELKPEPPEELK